MNFTHLRSFVEVAKARSFTVAGDALCLTQPAISFHIKQLEADLGIKLFIRQGRQIELTPAARTVLSYTEPIFNIAERLQQEVRSLSSHHSTAVNIGTGVFFAEHYLPEILAGFRKQFPNIDIRCEAKQTRALLADVHNFDYDFAFLGDIEADKDLNVQTLAYDDILVIVAADHPLSARTSLTIQDFANWPLITYPSGSETQAIVEEFLKNANIVPPSSFVYASSEGIKRAVEAGIGIALFPRKPAARELKEGSLKCLSIEGFDLRRRYTLVFRRDNPLSPTSKVFRDAVLTWRTRNMARLGRVRG